MPTASLPTLLFYESEYAFAELDNLLWSELFVKGIVDLDPAAV